MMIDKNKISSGQHFALVSPQLSDPGTPTDYTAFSAASQDNVLLCNNNGIFSPVLDELSERETTGTFMSKCLMTDAGSVEGDPGLTFQPALASCSKQRWTILIEEAYIYQRILKLLSRSMVAVHLVGECLAVYRILLDCRLPDAPVVAWGRLYVR